MRNCEANKTGKDRETEKKKEKNEHIYVDDIYNLSMLLILCLKHSSQQVDVCIEIW